MDKHRWADEQLRPYCNTDRQRECLDTLIETGTIAEAARKLGVDPKAVRKSVGYVAKRAEKFGYNPEYELNRPMPPEMRVGLTGLSDMRTNSEGKPVWYKFSLDKQAQHDAMLHAIESMAKEVRPLPPVKPPQHDVMEDLLSVYPMGDPHFGMYSWAAETGDDFDLGIAERDLYAAVDYLVDRSPPSKRGALVNLGDFYHAENMEGVTTRSGNVLDMDTRFAHMIDVGITTLRRCIDRMLEKHEHVEMINAPGNHDETVSLFMSVMFRTLYEKETRVTIHDSPTMRHYIRHGKVLIGVVHGHQTKDADLPGIMATERAKDWGDTEFRYYYRGHHHQDRRLEYNGCLVEQFRTLAAKDAYAAGHGYLSGRDMKCIVMHREYGEQSRFTCGIDVVRDKIRGNAA